MDNNGAVALELENVSNKRGHRNNGFGTVNFIYIFKLKLRFNSLCRIVRFGLAFNSYHLMFD